ncbi:hypothetical protein ILFOPFJJ_06935 [Ensifer psoraleae]|uniref:hypothetical protein n=1 Tax=Sinorhizobium psoraleae TaxID=520838 RepID=UPI001AEE8415|nr:hypothetical protein [Sinorhizobium psoraleae]NRP76011.1 hypothetical protein [Sinorhizobium psoraleae]
MGSQRLDTHELVAQLGEQPPIERRSRGRLIGVCRPAIQPGQKPKISSLGIVYWIPLAGARQVFGTMLPQGLEGSCRRGVVDLLKEAAQPFAFRAAVLGIDRIVDVDVQLRCEEFRET